MKFNLYQLCEENQNKGSLKTVMNKKLQSNLHNAVQELKRNSTLKNLAKSINVDYTTLWKHLHNKQRIPLIILKKLEEITNTPLHQSIYYIQSPRSKPIKIPKELNSDLCKLIGCIIADGHLKVRKSGRGDHYELVIREEYQDNMILVKSWMKSLFDFDVKLNKKDNHYFIYLSNKCIHDFFTKIIMLPDGNKSSIIKTPDFILELNKIFKLSYLKGLFMFDGGVDYRTGYVNYISKSKKLIEDILHFLNEIKLEPDYISLSPDRFQRYKIRFRKKEKLTKCLSLFEEKTEKWWRLHEHIYGLNGITKDLKTLLKSFDKYYPRVKRDVLTFSDIIKTLNKTELDILSLCKKLKRGKTVVYEYLKKLERWDVISSSRKQNKKYYKLNLIYKIPRRDIYG